MAQNYAIENIDEAKSYISHPILGSRLREITNVSFVVFYRRNGIYDVAY